MDSEITAYKISDRLYRVKNSKRNTVKDVWLKNGEIVPTTISSHILTPREQMVIEMELF